MLSPRQETILKIIVDDYIATAVPISSESVARSHNLGVSSATVRNDVSDLEEAGYIAHPYSSAGSVPLDRAYRFYVESAVTVEVEQLPQEVRSAIRRELSDVEQDVDAWASAAAAVLARHIGNMALATFPKARESRVKHVELVHLQDLLVMLIVVLEQARLRRHLIRLKGPVEPSELETSSNRVKSHVMGRNRREIEAMDVELNPFEEELVGAAALILDEEDKSAYRGHYVDGLRNLVSQPEFVGSEMMTDLVGGVEDGSLVEAILKQVPKGGVVRVTIGQENSGDILWPLSVVICQYGIPDEAVGVVGAVGPTRMEYSKTMAGVQYLSSVMSDLVEGVHGG